jgi:hypothetical protein
MFHSSPQTVLSAGQSLTGDLLVGCLYRSVVTYLNDVILGEKLINEDVVHPQRHPTDNVDQSQFFLRARGTKTLALVMWLPILMRIS